jgi:hypothetical protein
MARVLEEKRWRPLLPRECNREVRMDQTPGERLIRQFLPVQAYTCFRNRAGHDAES